VTQRRARGLGLVDELQRSHRFTLGVLVSVLVLSLATSGYLLLVSQPHVTTYITMGKHARDAHDGMLDQETGLRGWLATDRPEFLAPYRSGRRNAQRAVGQLLVEIKKSPDVTDEVLRMLLARQRWQAWATRAAALELTPRQRIDGTLTRFLREGKQLFDAYRAEEVASTTDIRSRRTEAVQDQNLALELALASYLVLLGVTGAVTVRRRRRLQSTILAPIDNLHDTITAIRSGDLTARAEPTAVPELEEIGSALGGLAAELTTAGIEARARERRLAKLAYRFETVVRVGREIAGSLSVRYVSASVTTAAAELLSTPTVLWLRGENQAFQAIHRSTDPHGAAPPPGLEPPGLVARAAAEAQPTSEGGSRAYPLVLAGMVTAVLEVSTPMVDEDTEQVLQALLSTAAASLESAHLHSTARELADLDGLTHLPNRRRFEVDVDTEWERCRRYGRPMSMVMMDLDHFKRLNDEHGHLLGDEVLREVAAAVGSVLRSTDTAYRYGGEEIVLLLRETGLEDATAAAERVRGAVAALSFPQHPRVSVTGSAGVATRNASMAHFTELVAEADGALYEAKRQGRDRVVTARGPEGSVLFHGEPDAPSVRDEVTPG
jgi:diguanylate cyclase (GGDEF)-like protein